jgi:hypothetical protein
MEVDGAMSSPRRHQWRTAELGGGVRAREAGGWAGFIPAGGRLGASGVTPVTHARVEKPWHGRRRASLRRPMARHGWCAGRWIGATWRGPLTTDVTGRFPPSQRPVVTPVPRRARMTRVRHVRWRADVAARDVAVEHAPAFQGIFNSLIQFSNTIFSEF